MTSPISEPNPSSRASHLYPAPPWPRYANALVGAWLLLSTFLWTHTPSARSNTWIVGLMMTIAALWAVSAPAVRWFNTALAVWLGLSTFAMPDIRPQTFYNNLLVAMVAFILSLMPSPEERHRPS
jgi:hypothetical protein